MTIRRASLSLLLCLHASAADRTIAQYVHKAWVAKDGAPANIMAITQTNDGYLWLASSQGLYRFDGVEFERFELSGQPLVSASIRSLLSCSNGDLWIGSGTSAVSLLRNGVNRNYTTADGFPEGAVWSIAQDRQGTIWAATESGLARFDGAKWRKIGPESGFEGRPISLYLDRSGALWVATPDTILYLPQATAAFQRTGFQVLWVTHMLESPNGTIWMAETMRSVRPMPPLKGPEIAVGSTRILFDRKGNLWIATIGDGLKRAPYPDRLTSAKIEKSSGQIESFTVKDGLSADYVTSVYQDREGNVWAGTAAGLDRFTEAAVRPVPVPGSFSRAMMAPGEHGDIWVGRLSEDVGRVHDNQWFPGRMPFSVFSVVAGADGTTWWTGNAGAAQEINGHVTRFELPQAYVDHNVQITRIAIDRSGALWLSGSFGIFVRRGSEWNALEPPSGFPGKNAISIYADAFGRVWFGYLENSILLVDGANQRVFSGQDGLRAGAVQSIFASASSAWIAGSNGLQLFDGQHFRDILPMEGGSFGRISGVLETSDGSLWMNSYRGIVRIAPAVVSKLKSGANSAAYSIFDSYDGLRGATQQEQPYPTLIQATDGKLWFATSAGPVWIDPQDLPRNALPPPVAVRSIAANGKRYASFTNLRLPKLTRDLEIGYTALSFTVPERVRFRYKLDGSDKDWRDGGTRRQATYTNLGPGPYRFLVMASNNDGVWNQAGADITFRIDAAFYQTVWFQALCYAAGLALLGLLYWYQLQQATARVHSRMEGQMAERERIARELHDTLLQSFQGSLFEFQAGRNLLSRRPEEAVHTLDDAIRSAEAAIAEGRDAIQDLRSGSTVGRDLAHLFSGAGRELSNAQASNGNGPEFRVTVEGTPRAHPPVLQDELYRIGMEVLRNAFRHARAKRIEVEIRYGAEELRLRIRDDGIGIDPKVLNAGARPGHWGLQGVRERAKLAGAELDFWSEAEAGTEVQIKVPAAVAYATPRRTDMFRFFRKKITIHAD